MAQPTFIDMLDRMEARKSTLVSLQKHLRGQQPAAYLSAKSREALDKRLASLSVNYPRLIVTSRTDRLTLTGFRLGDAPQADETTWRLWRGAGLVALSDLVHADWLGYGSAYVTVWAGQRAGRPVVTASADNGLTVYVDTDPVTGDRLASVRRWSSRDASHAVEMRPDVIRTYTAGMRDAPAASGAWNITDERPNPLGLVPVVPFTRRGSCDDDTGASAVADVLDLTDAYAKVLADALVGSEFYARPRRWATGMEIEEDEDGNPVDPFGEGRLLQSESPDTKFGQLESSRSAGYTDLLGVLSQQIGALSGLPGHYLGLNAGQPPNADSLRAAEAQLVSMAYSDHRQLDPQWSEVASLLHLVSDPNSVPVNPAEIRPVWASPEARTPGQSADAAAKLHGIGVPLRALLSDPLGYEPDDVDRIVSQARADAVQRAGLDLGSVLP